MLSSEGQLFSPQLKTKIGNKETEFSIQVCFHDLVIHKQVKISDIISRRCGDFMTPLSTVEMRLKLTMRVQELQLIYIVEMVTQIL